MKFNVLSKVRQMHFNGRSNVKGVYFGLLLQFMDFFSKKKFIQH